ncbi:MAG: hypothetical protein JNM84_21400 [Planctomycetes bacterium]|nr:hypothetical protein [Planctomycetota bacterium]
MSWSRSANGGFRVCSTSYELAVEGSRVRFLTTTSSDAERPAPEITLRLAELRSGARGIALLAAPEIAPRDERVELDHGALIERWTPRSDEVEQDFVLATRPAGLGDLVVRLAVETELTLLPSETGLLWGTRDGKAQIAYGDLTVIDARGERLEQRTRFVDGKIELRVPEEFLARAAFPITLDPVIRGFSMRNGPIDDAHPDVAIDGVRDRFAATFRVGADIYFRAFTRAGALLAEIPVDTSAAQSVAPRIALARSTTPGLADRYLVVWTDVASGTTTNRIRGLLIDAAALAPIGAAFDIAAAGAAELHPDVGATEGSFLVVWDAQPAGSVFRQVRARTIAHASGARGPVLRLSPGSNAAQTPSVPQWVRSTSTGTNAWIAVYIGDGEVRASSIDTTGTLLQVDVPIGASAQGANSPDIAGNGIEFLAVWSTTTPAGMHAAFLRQSGTLQPVGAPFLLTSAEPGGRPWRDVFQPRVATDGVRYAYVYAEMNPGTFFDVYAGALVGGTVPLLFLEGRVPIASSPLYENMPAVAMEPAELSTEPARALIAYTVDNAGAPLGRADDIEAVIYDAGAPGSGVSSRSTACGGANAPTLSASGSAVLGTSVLFQLSVDPTALPVLLVGAEAPVPLPLCAAQASCALGLGAIYVWLPGSSQIAIGVPADPALLAASIAVQGLEIANAPLANGCGAPVLPIALRASDTLVLRPR